MKLGLLTAAILLSTTMGVSAQPAPSPTPQASPTAQPSPPDYSYLNTQLQQAYCTQNWGGAIGAVDKMMGVVSKQPNASIYMPALATYRRRLQGLLYSRAIVPVASLSGCTTAGAGTNPANNTPARANTQPVPR